VCAVGIDNVVNLGSSCSVCCGYRQCGEFWEFLKFTKLNCKMRTNFKNTVLLDCILSSFGNERVTPISMTATQIFIFLTRMLYETHGCSQSIS